VSQLKTKIDLEDTFGDIVGKASRGTRINVDRLSKLAGIDRSRLEQLLADKAQPTDAEAQAIATALGLNPEKLADIGQRRWYPDDFVAPDYLLHQINRPHPSNGYFLILPDAKVGAFIDPAGHPSSIIDPFTQAQVQLQYILLTHKHSDHVDALAQVRKAFPSALPVIHELDAHEVGASARGAVGIRDGDRLPFGDSEITMVHTPGHTDGSSCFIYKGSIFTGDALFAGSIGRTNGPQFGYDDHRNNIRAKILSLPENTVILPGHGPASTVAQEKAHNPFF
jgi:glyoxylase-like metal-dependent hydrolase (beta-lactamase superfamily II)